MALTILAAAWVLGLALGWATPLPWTAVALWAVAALALWGCLALRTGPAHAFAEGPPRVAFWGLLAAAALLGGLWWGGASADAAPGPLPTQDVTFRAQVVSDPRQSGAAYRIEVAPLPGPAGDGVVLPDRVLVTLRPHAALVRQRDAPYFRYGDVLLFEGRLENSAALRRLRLPRVPGPPGHRRGHALSSRHVGRRGAGLVGAGPGVRAPPPPRRLAGARPAAAPRRAGPGRAARPPRRPPRRRSRGLPGDRHGPPAGHLRAARRRSPRPDPRGLPRRAGRRPMAPPRAAARAVDVRPAERHGPARGPRLHHGHALPRGALQRATRRGAPRAQPRRGRHGRPRSGAAPRRLLPAQLHGHGGPSPPRAPLRRATQRAARIAAGRTRAAPAMEQGLCGRARRGRGGDVGHAAPARLSPSTASPYSAYQPPCSPFPPCRPCSSGAR